MPSLALTLTSTALPTNWTGTLETFRQELLSSIGATVLDTSQLILGQIGGTTPSNSATTPVWLDTTLGIWKYWNGSAYVATAVRLGGPTFYTTLVSTPSATQTITIPNLPAGGTLATLTDVYTPRATRVTTLTGGINYMDWELSNSFTATIGSPQTYGVSNSVAGQEAFIAVHNGNTVALLISWTSEIHFAAPTTIAASKTDLYVLRNVGGVIYGVAYQGY